MATIYDSSNNTSKEAASNNEASLESGAASTTASSSRSEPSKHALRSLFVRDSIIGFADGLTVPFALTAGLSYLGDSKIVILGGLAELFAGSISMGLGAYLAAVTERKHYEVEERKMREEREGEEEVVYGLFDGYGLGRERCRGVVEGLREDREVWTRFLMDFEKRMEKPETKTAWLEGAVMGISYFLGESSSLNFFSNRLMIFLQVDCFR